MAGIVDSLKKRVGETGEVIDAGLAWMERQAAETADMKVPVLSAASEAVVQPALMWGRAVNAGLTSDGGKNFQPEVRDEKYFSQDALKELAKAAGETGGRVQGADSPAQFGATQTVGGFSVKDGKLTDTADINKSYDGVPQIATDIARTVLPTDDSPDAGKVRTEIPMETLAKFRQDAKGGKTKKRKAAKKRKTYVTGYPIPPPPPPDGNPPPVNAAQDGGDTEGAEAPIEPREPAQAAPAPAGGPRIVINPSVFRDKRDALCVAFNERFRVFMEQEGYEPESEPTAEQRKFFSDTAYADDETQLRRTILARIATLDTSVKDPTDDQLRETLQMLQDFQQKETPSNAWEEGVIERLVRLVERVAAAGRPVEPRADLR